MSSPAPELLLLLSRLLWYLGVTGVVGACVFQLLVAPAAQRSPGLNRAAAKVGLAGALIVTAGLLARLAAQTLSYFGDEEPLSAALLAEVATAIPPWSRGWMLQAVAAASAVAALALARWRLHAGWRAAHVAALALAVTLPLTGHAVAQDAWYALPVTLQAGHVLGAGLWIGGLFVLVAVGIRPAHREAATPGAVRLVRAFSPVALSGAAIVVLTGLATTWLYLERLSDLWLSEYGRTLLVKVSLVGAVAGVGFVNWRRLGPHAGQPDGLARLHRAAVLELTAAVLVLAATALLTGLPQPSHEP